MKSFFIKIAVLLGCLSSGAAAHAGGIFEQEGYSPCNYAKNLIKDSQAHYVGGIVGSGWLEVALCTHTLETCWDIGNLCPGSVGYEDLDQLCTPGHQLRICVPKSSPEDTDGLCVGFNDGCPANADVCEQASCDFASWTPSFPPVPDVGGGPVQFSLQSYERPVECVYTPYDDGSPACGGGDGDLQIPPPPPTEHPCDEFEAGSKDWWCCMDPLSSECLPGDLTTPTGGTTTGGTTTGGTTGGETSGGTTTGGTTGGETTGGTSGGETTGGTTGGTGTGGTTTGGETTGGTGGESGPCDGIEDPALQACCEEHGGLTLEAVMECIPDSDDPSGDCNIIVNVGGDFVNNGQLNICCQYVNNAGVIQDSEIVQECENAYGPGGSDGNGTSEPGSSEIAGEGFACSVTASADKASGKLIAVDSDGTGITLTIQHSAPSGLAGASHIALSQAEGPAVAMSGPATQPFATKASWSVEMGRPDSMVGKYIPSAVFLVTTYGTDGSVLNQSTCSEQAGLQSQGGSGGCSFLPEAPVSAREAIALTLILMIPGFGLAGIRCRKN